MGPGEETQARVPYREVYAIYAKDAEATLAREPLPPVCGRRYMHILATWRPKVAERRNESLRAVQRASASAIRGIRSSSAGFCVPCEARCANWLLRHPWANALLALQVQHKGRSAVSRSATCYEIPIRLRRGSANRRRGSFLVFWTCAARPKN